MTQYLNISVPRCDPDTALELVAHHLSLAYAYYEITTDDLEVRDAEIARIMCARHGTVPRWEDDGGFGRGIAVPLYTGDTPASSPIELSAAKVWLAECDRIHAEWKKQEEE